MFNESLLTLLLSTKQNSLKICPLVTLRLPDINYSDRKKVGKKSGGGCALYISDNVNIDEKPELIPQYIEGICGVVTFPSKRNIIAALTLYRQRNEKINWFDKILDNVSNNKLNHQW